MIIWTVWTHEVEYNWKKVWFLRRLYVDKKYRWYWFWKILLKIVEGYCISNWWEFLIFWVDKRVNDKWWVRNFYLKNWYEEFFDNIPEYLLDDNDDWYYRKKLI